MFTIGIEEKVNVGTYSPLTVIIQLDPRLRFEEISVAESFVPSNFQRPLSNVKYFVWFKFIGDTPDGKKVDLSFSRCEKCKSRMRTKNKEDPESDRFCDVLSSSIIQTRKIEGNRINL